MAATDPGSLLSNPNVACYESFCQSSTQKQLLELALLQQIVLALNPSAKTDPGSLLSQANVACYESYCQSPELKQLLELALLQQIAQAA
jgi:hypothetical protein